MDRWGVTVELLDSMSALFVAPQVAGAVRLERVRAVFIRNAERPVQAFGRAWTEMKRILRESPLMMLLISICGAAILAAIELTEPGSWSFRLHLAAVSIVSMVAGIVGILVVLAVLPKLIRGVLWVPLAIAMRQTMSRSVLATGFGMFALARGIAIALAASR
jgi:hypothetical protein